MRLGPDLLMDAGGNVLEEQASQLIDQPDLTDRTTVDDPKADFRTNIAQLDRKESEAESHLQETAVESQPAADPGSHSDVPESPFPANDINGAQEEQPQQEWIDTQMAEEQELVPDVCWTPRAPMSSRWCKYLTCTSITGARQ